MFSVNECTIYVCPYLIFVWSNSAMRCSCVRSHRYQKSKQFDWYGPESAGVHSTKFERSWERILSDTGTGSTQWEVLRCVHNGFFLWNLNLHSSHAMFQSFLRTAGQWAVRPLLSPHTPALPAPPLPFPNSQSSFSLFPSAAALPHSDPISSNGLFFLAMREKLLSTQPEVYFNHVSYTEAVSGVTKWRRRTDFQVQRWQRNPKQCIETTKPYEGCQRKVGHHPPLRITAQGSVKLGNQYLPSSVSSLFLVAIEEFEQLQKKYDECYEKVSCFNFLSHRVISPWIWNGILFD